ncbi:Lipoate-protein ligase A subunit 1 [uncultured archaeon]|nr:Lipoate-protein ligase A subunit 1 [uncultured archaeon]
MIEGMVETEWRLIELSSGHPVKQTAVDEVIIEQVAAGKSPPTIRFWQVERPTISVGRNQSLEDDVYVRKAVDDGIEIVRRPSGGGSDYLSADDICYSVIIPANLLSKSAINTTKNYLHVYKKIASALKSVGIETHFENPCNIMTGNRKIGNMAQFAPSGVVLVHGKIRYSLPLDRTLRHFVCKECKEAHSLLLHRKSFAEAMTCVADHKVPFRKLYSALKSALVEGLKYKSAEFISGEERKLLEDKEKFYDSDNWKKGASIPHKVRYGFCDEHLNGVPIIKLYK